MIRTLAFLLAAIAARGAENNPLSAEAKADYLNVRRNMIRAAEKMPEGKYAFKPVSEVRTFAALIAHVADDQYNLCAPVKGETRQAAYSELEQTLSKKGELVDALKKAFEYCDGAYNSVTDKTAADPVMFFNMSRAKLSMLNWNTWHTWEHYGNVVVYLRINGLVPPSSEQKK